MKEEKLLRKHTLLKRKLIKRGGEFTPKPFWKRRWEGADLVGWGVIGVTSLAYFGFILPFGFLMSLTFLTISTGVFMAAIFASAAVLFRKDFAADINDALLAKIQKIEKKLTKKGIAFDRYITEQERKREEVSKKFAAEQAKKERERKYLQCIAEGRREEARLLFLERYIEENPARRPYVEEERKYLLRVLAERKQQETAIVDTTETDNQIVSVDEEGTTI